MKLKKFFIPLLSIMLLSLTGCFEKEELIPRTEINEIRIPYSLYEFQTYYRLEDETIVSHNGFEEWDLGFESAENGFAVILNSSRYMHAGYAGTTDFDAVISNSADTMIFDDSSGDLRKCALSGWVDATDPLNPVFSGNVYIIDRGVNESGESLGLLKLLVEKLEDETFYIRFSNLDGTNDHSCQVVKDHTLNFTLFSFDDGGKTVPIQPPESDWDLCFTRYSTVIEDNYGVPTPYIVRGVFINNPAGVMAAVDTVNPYYDINLSTIQGYTFSSRQDVIGYEWKEYRDESYTLIDKISYVIRDSKGGYYKIRFTDYFNEAGQRGYPAFEQIRLPE
ncbi:MAG: HmuY family protein [Bacteroidales bacterium]